MSLDHFRLFHVLPGNLLVAPDTDINRKGSIIFPDMKVEKAQTGLVLQHAELCEDSLEGQHIVFAKWEWRTLRMRGVELYIIDERSVFAVIERETGNSAQVREKV